MFANKNKNGYNHVLVFAKPKFSRDKGIIRLCKNDPKHRFKLKTVECIDDYLNKEQYEYNKDKRNGKEHIYHGIIPIMYLSEWKTSSRDYKQLFAQCLCRGFPRLQIISHKGNLANLLNKCQDKLVDNGLFYPRTYVIPNDTNIFFMENKRFCDAMNYDCDENIKFIMKPQGKSKGNGISLVSTKSDIDFNSAVVIQRYITNPLLISGHKFDLRLYVLIASINPLQLYIYDKGLVRFASTEYSNSNKDVLCSHLTNYTLNKAHPSFKSKNKEIKWSLQAFWEYINTKEKENNNMINMEQKQQYDDDECDLKQYILHQIEEMIRNVFNIGYAKLNEGFSYSFSNDIKNHGRCFDILGMDVLIDTNYRCWLMEFNRYPSLKCEHQIDKNIKYDLCHDLFKMLKPRIICNHTDNIMYHHKMPVILNPTGTYWRRVL